MNNKIKLIFPFAISLLLASCNTGSSSPASSAATSEESRETSSLPASSSSAEAFYKIKFIYNAPDKYDDVYTIEIVYPNELVGKPKTPSVPHYIFTNWAYDKEGNEPFSGFGLTIDRSVTLYGQWIRYSKATNQQKLELLFEKLDCPGVVVGAHDTVTTQVQNAMAGATIYTYFKEVYYERYSDITFARTYDSEKTSAGASLLLTNQYSYDAKNFYAISDYPDSSKSGKVVAGFDPLQIDRFLNITFFNKDLGALTSFAYYFENDLPLPEGISLDLTSCDPTIFTPEIDGVYDIGYKLTAVYDATETLGNYVTEIDQYYFKINVKNNLIISSYTEEQYLFAIGEDVYEYDILTKQSTYSYADSYSKYTGDRLDPNDYPTYEDQ